VEVIQSLMPTGEEEPRCKSGCELVVPQQ